MALVKVTPAFNGITENIIVNINTGGTRVKGFWVDGLNISTAIIAVVQPMSLEEINELSPDGDNTETHLKFYINIEDYPLDIKTAHGTETSTQVTYLDNQYKVLSIKNYGVMGGYMLLKTIELNPNN